MKRQGEVFSSFGKKAKFSNQVEDLWFDDLDEEDLDDCFNLATQACELKTGPAPEPVITAHESNVSVLSYSNFQIASKQTFATSTQLQLQQSNSVQFKHPNGCTSSSSIQISQNNPNWNRLTLEEEVRELRQKCKEKEGEASILREQIKDLKAANAAEQQKKLQELKDVLNNRNKEVNALKTQLEFKNLEIGNLNRKVAEVSKRTFESFTSLKIHHSNRRSPSPVRVKIEPGTSTSIHIVHSIEQPFYPLKHLASLELFIKDPYQEPIASPQNHINKSNNKSYKCSSNNDNTMKSDVNFVDIYDTAKVLLNSTSEELDLDVRNKEISMMICLSSRSIIAFNDYLKSMMESSRIEDIQHLDFLLVTKPYSLSREKSSQMVTNATNCLLILGELVLCSKYCKNCVMFQNDSSYRNPNLNVSINFLNVIIDTLRLIGQSRRSYVYPEFLISAVKFLRNICKASRSTSSSPSTSAITITENNNIIENVSEAFKELLFSRPDSNVLRHVVSFMKEATSRIEFVEFLCSKPVQVNVKMLFKKGILYFNNNSCRFHIFTFQFENNIMMNKSNLDINFCSEMLCLASNMLSANAEWLYRDGTRCRCLEQFYKLIIKLIYRFQYHFKKYYKKQGIVSEQYTTFFKASVTILSLLIFNSYEETEKYITLLSECREAIRFLLKYSDILNLSDSDSKQLSKLNSSEDLAAIPSHKIVF